VPRLSARTGWNLRPNRIATLAAERRARGARILDLTESNPTKAGIEVPGDAIQGALSEPGSLVYAPEPRGMASARQAVARWYEREGFAVSPERLVLTASTSEAYAWLFKLLCDPGDEVIVPAPSYPLFEFLATLESVVLRTVPLEHDGRFRLDLAALERAIGPRTRAVVVVHPGNPTGAFLQKDELAALDDLCRRRDLAIVSDEVFWVYGSAPDARRAGVVALATGALSFSMSGLSKPAGLPQLKCGWIVVGGAAPLAEAALERLEMIADTYLSVGTPVQVGLDRLLVLGDEVRKHIQGRALANRTRLERAVAAAPALSLLPAEGGWYAVVRIPLVKTEEEWVLALLGEDGVLVQPGYFFDFPMRGLLVVSLLTPEDELEEGIGRIVERARRA
jgi:aspartate/methionine/tyrosine aminotransferase